MTNLLAAITAVVLVTNTEVKYPTMQVPDPCPEGRIGCLVYHSHSVPLPNPTNRTRIDTTYRAETVSIPALKVVITNKWEFLSSVVIEESLQTNPIWVEQSRTTNLFVYGATTVTDMLMQGQTLTNYAHQWIYEITNNYYKR
jgi:hypothetical protein